MKDRITSPATTAIRIATAAVGLLALGGSINALNAADAVSVPVVAAASLPSDLPRFQPSPEAEFAGAFGDLGAKSAIEVTAGAVDLTAITPAAPTFDDVPDGMASWYGNELAGHRTANGERFDPATLTAAHRTLPLGTRLLVTYHGRSVVVRINDRGPYAAGRVIDLSRAAAEQIGLRRAGSGRVELARLAS